MPVHKHETKTAVMEDGSTRTLTFEEWQPYEPSSYSHEEGSWCVAAEDDAYYFVAESGRVDIHDEESGICIQFGAGWLAKEMEDRAADEEDARREWEQERDYDRRKYGP